MTDEFWRCNTCGKIHAENELKISINGKCFVHGMASLGVEVEEK